MSVTSNQIAKYCEIMARSLDNKNAAFAMGLLIGVRLAVATPDDARIIMNQIEAASVKSEEARANLEFMTEALRRMLPL